VAKSRAFQQFHDSIGEIRRPTDKIKHNEKRYAWGLYWDGLDDEREVVKAEKRVEGFESSLLTLHNPVFDAAEAYVHLTNSEKQEARSAALRCIETDKGLSMSAYVNLGVARIRLRETEFKENADKDFACARELIEMRTESLQYLFITTTAGGGASHARSGEDGDSTLHDVAEQIAVLRAVDAKLQRAQEQLREHDDVTVKFVPVLSLFAASGSGSEKENPTPWSGM